MGIKIFHFFHRFLSEHDSVEGGLRATSLVCFFYLYSLVFESPVPMRIRVESDVPIGAGLGSSAAISVCLAAGLANIAEGGDKTMQPDLDLINRLALISEKIIHGPGASGLDNHVSTYGGMVIYNKEEGNINRMESPPIKVLLVDTGVSRLTKNLVEKVAKQMRDYPDVINPILKTMDGISKNCKVRASCKDPFKISLSRKHNYAIFIFFFSYVYLILNFVICKS